MKRLRDWWVTKAHSTLACALGFHRSCNGQAVPRNGWVLSPDPMCWCDCHYRL